MKIAIVAGIALIAGAIVFAQNPNPQMPDYTKVEVSNERDDLWFETKVGSFKLVPRGTTIPSGELAMKFTGSVLISEMNGTVTPEGNVRREYVNKERKKEVWFGTGKLTIKGSFRAVQWFGRDLKAKFNGNGFIRLYGEFDKDLETGFYWFDPAKKQYWGNFGAGVQIPEVQFGLSPNSVKTREEIEKGKGAGKG